MHYLLRRIRRVKLILPALTEATSPYWRPIKYALFPPLGLATLAAYLDPSLDITVHDEHVEPLALDDDPDLVIVQVYITNAYRAYRIADHYRRKGAHVALVRDLAAGVPQARYVSTARTLEGVPPIRRDLIKRERYLVPNSIVVSRGCPHHCTFCYKDAFFDGGRSFYTQRVDDALAEIARLPGRHLYFLDDHLLGRGLHVTSLPDEAAPHADTIFIGPGEDTFPLFDRRFARELFTGMQGMNRVFQGAATVDSILRDDTIELAAQAGLRSIFVGFETLTRTGLAGAGKRQNLGRDYGEVVRKLDSLGIMINGSFVFGLDGDDEDVFARTVDWAVASGITTATFHILTPYPGTPLHAQMAAERRLTTTNWDLYDTRHVVYRPATIAPERLKAGYDWAYRAFYAWPAIFKAASTHQSSKHALKHLAYSAGWKKFEPAWDVVIRLKQLAQMRPTLEAVLSSVAPKCQPNQAPVSLRSQQPV